MRSVVAAVLVTCGLLVAGCTGAKPTPEASIVRQGNPASAGANGKGELVARSQSGDGSTIVVDLATLPKPGYVVVYADGGGAPGQRLGASSLLSEGPHKDVAVALSSKVSDGATLHVMLHAEDNGDKTFDYPSHDAPLEIDGAVIETTLTVKVSGQ